MKSPVKAINFKIIAQKIEAKEKTVSGILLGNAKEEPVYAEVVSVGEKVTNVKIGDKIFYKDYSATELKLEEKSFLVIEEEDILGIMEGK